MPRRVLLVVIALFFAAFPMASAQESATPAADTANSGLTIVASDLANPRGFAWSPDGTLYLALAGRGGDTEIPVIEGFTLKSGLSSSVVTVVDGCVTPVVQGLVSTTWAEPVWTWGAMDVAFLGEDLYVLASGAGPTWISPTSRSGVYRVNEDGSMTLVADITTWLPEHPPQFIPPDYGADGSLFDLAAAGDALLVSEAVGGQIFKVTPEGEISVLADLSEGHPVPTGIAVDAEGNAYVGFETTPPYADGSTKIVKITPDGTVSDQWTGLTRLGGVAMSPDGTLYAVELSTGNTDEAPFTHANTGRVVRQTGPDSLEVVAEGLDYPVGLGFASEGTLYVSGPGEGENQFNGWLAQIALGDASATPMAAMAGC